MLRGRTTWSIHRSVRSEFELRDRSQRREFCVIRMIVYGSRYTLYVFVMTCKNVHMARRDINVLYGSHANFHSSLSGSTIQRARRHGHGHTATPGTIE